MDEECDLVIDDETVELSRASNKISKDIKSINSKYKHNEDKSYKELNETSVIQSQDSYNKSDDDYIHVIDNDDDYEQSVQKLICVANNIGREYHKQFKEAETNTMLTDSQVHKDESINRGITNQVQDHRTLHRLGLSNESQYVLEDIPNHRNKNAFGRKMDDYMQEMRTLPNISAAQQAYRYHDTDRAEVDSSIDDNYPMMNRYDPRHIHRPEIPLRNLHGPIDINTYFHVRRPTLNTNGPSYDAISRATKIHHYIPEDMLSIDEYRRAAMNTAPQFYSHRPDLIRLDDYMRTSIEREARGYAHRLHEPMRSDYGNTIIGGFPYSHYIPDHALDDYWQAMMSRHAYRPEGVICMEDYDRYLRNWHVYSNAYKPPIGLSLEPYRSIELPHIYRPDLVNMDIHREPMLTTYALHPETAGMYCYRPQIDPYTTEIDDVNRKENNCTLTLSRNQETTIAPASTPRNAINNKNKLRPILSTRNQDSKAPLNKKKKSIRKTGNVDLPVFKNENSLTYRTMEDHINKRNITTLSVNKPESEYMDNSKPGVFVIKNEPDTVILSSKNIYQKRTPNQIIQSDALAGAKTNSNTNHTSNTTAKEIDNHGVALDENAEQFSHELNKTHDEKGVDRESNTVHRDISVQLLVVFFTRVKELVKDTFPEFSKSLEREIETMGKRTNSGRLKTDIKYICPLYCSVSTYSLPRFDNTGDDNTIAKHRNRTKICDVCVCIQNCYKLYKRKYFNLVSPQSGKTQEKGTLIENETVKANMSESTLGIRAQTVICRRQGTDCEEIIVGESKSNEDNELKIYNKGPGLSITDGKTLNKETIGGYSTAVANRQPIADSCYKTLLDPLSVLNFNPPSKHIENAMNSPNWVPSISIDDNDIIHTHNNQLEIEKPVLKTNNDKEEIIIDYSSQNRQNFSENRVKKDNYPKDKNKAKIALSLSFNEMTNAHKVTSKLKDKINKIPDTVFRCHICNSTFTYLSSFVIHMQKEHNIIEIDEDLSDECIVRKCQFCGVYSKQKYHNDHVQRTHPKLLTRKKKASKKEPTKVNKRRKSMKRKFIFICLVCHKNLKSCEVQRHREIEHKGLKVAKMFTKKLSSMD